MNLSLDDATTDDLDQIVSIYNSTVSGRMVTADLEPVTVASKEKWFHEHTASRPLWVARNEESIMIGWVSFQDFYGRPAYAGTAEISIYLDPAFRGQGLGRLLLEMSMKRCPDLGIDILLGYIFSHNEPSIRLFSQAGFESWALLKDIANMDGKRCSLTIMGKKLMAADYYKS